MAGRRTDALRASARRKRQTKKCPQPCEQGSFERFLREANRKPQRKALNNGESFSSWSRTGHPELLTRRPRASWNKRTLCCSIRSLARNFATGSPTAELVDVGKDAPLELLTQDEINSLLVAYAGRHETVVR